MSIGERIMKLRKADGLSQEQLAERIGVSRQAVSKWESDICMPDTEKIILLSDFFAVSTDYLLKGKETPIDSIPIQKNKETSPLFITVVAIILALSSIPVYFGCFYSGYLTLFALPFAAIFLIASIILFFYFLFSMDKTNPQYLKAKKILFIFAVWFGFTLLFAILGAIIVFLYDNLYNSIFSSAAFLHSTSVISLIACIVGAVYFTIHILKRK